MARSPGSRLWIDGDNHLHRVLFSGGSRQNVVQLLDQPGLAGLGFGFDVFLKSIARWVREHGASQVVIAWDTGRSPTRTRLMESVDQDKKEGYKARRSVTATEEEREVLEAYSRHFQSRKRWWIVASPFFGFRSFVGGRLGEGCEADDLIALGVWLTTHPNLAPDKPYELDVFDRDIIVSDDHDFAQLVRSTVCLFRPRKGDIVTHSSFMERHTVPVGSFTLFKAIVGDTSDNIPGVFRVGPVSATELIRSYFQSEWSAIAGDAGGDFDDAWRSHDRRLWIHLGRDPEVFRRYLELHPSSAGQRVLESWETVVRNLRLVDSVHIFNPSEDHGFNLKTTLRDARIVISGPSAFDRDRVNGQLIPSMTNSTDLGSVVEQFSCLR